MQILAERNERQLYSSLFSAGQFILPDFVQGEVVPIEFSEITRIARSLTSRVFDPVDLSGAIVEVALGNPFARPIAGSFPVAVGPQLTSGTLTETKRFWLYQYEAGDDFENVGGTNAGGTFFEATGDTPTDWSNGSILFEITEDLPYDFDAEDLEDALNATQYITDKGGVTVAAFGVAGNFTITFNQAGAQETCFAYTANLAPLSNVDIAKLVTGDATKREVQHLRINQNASAKATLSDPLPSAAVNVTVLQSGGAGANHKIRVTLTPTPYDGKFTLTIGGSESGFIDYDASSASMTAVLESLASVGEGNVEVVQEANHSWLIMFVGSKANTNMGTITGSAAGLKVLQGFSGELDLRVPGIQLLLNGAAQVDTTFEVSIQLPGAEPFKIVQRVVRLKEGLIDPNTVTPNPVDTFLTAAQTQALIDALALDTAAENVRNPSAITALTGGGASALDGIATVDVSVGRLVAVEIGGFAYIYRLEAGTSAESAPAVIRPDDYNGSTNAKVWRLKSHYLNAPHFNGTPTFETGVPAAWRAALGLDTSTSVNVTIDDAGNTNIIPASSFRSVEATLTAEAGTGPYTRNVVLLSPAAGQVCTVNLLLNLAADNPTISIRNLADDGTELLEIPPTASARTASVVLRCLDGANWELFSANFNPE